MDQVAILPKPTPVFHIHEDVAYFDIFMMMTRLFIVNMVLQYLKQSLSWVVHKGLHVYIVEGGQIGESANSANSSKTGRTTLIIKISYRNLIHNSPARCPIASMTDIGNPFKTRPRFST
jgi:hypothetical protein